MGDSATIINFKLRFAPGVVETFTLPAIYLSNDFRPETRVRVPNLEPKLRELGLTMENVYMKNWKGSLVPLSRSVRKICAVHEVKLFAIVDSEDEEDSPDSSSGEEEEEEDVVIVGPESGQLERQSTSRERRRNRRREWRSRSRERSRSRHGSKKGKRILKNLMDRVANLERATVGHPIRTRGPAFELPGFGECRGKSGFAVNGGRGLFGGRGGLKRRFGGSEVSKGLGTYAAAAGENTERPEAAGRHGRSKGYMSS